MKYTGSRKHVSFILFKEYDLCIWLIRINCITLVASKAISFFCYKNKFQSWVKCPPGGRWPRAWDPVPCRTRISSSEHSLIFMWSGVQDQACELHIILYPSYIQFSLETRPVTNNLLSVPNEVLCAFTFSFNNFPMLPTSLCSRCCSKYQCFNSKWNFQSWRDWLGFHIQFISITKGFSYPVCLRSRLVQCLLWFRVYISTLNTLI